MPFFNPATVPAYINTLHATMPMCIDIDLAGVVVGSADVELVLAWSNGEPDIVEYEFDGIRIDVRKWNSASAREQAAFPDISVLIRCIEEHFRTPRNQGAALEALREAARDYAEARESQAA